MRKIIIALLISAFATALCFAGGTREGVNTKVTVIRDGSLTLFTDDLGRMINVKAGGFQNVIAATPAAQNYIYAINPDRLFGISSPWPKESRKIVSKAALNAPVYGIFDYMADSLSYGKIKASGADAILVVGNVGEYKSEITALLDEKQEELGLPFIFINDEVPYIPTTISRISLIISSYPNGEDPIEFAEEMLLPLYTTRNIVSYYYSGTEDGLTAYSEGDINTSVMQFMGLKNVIPAGSTAKMTAKDIRDANPDLILFDEKSAYDAFLSNAEFKGIRAVQNGDVYLVPNAPYNILSEDAGPGRLIGLQWMRMLAYKNLTMDNVVDDADDFFEEFYHSNLSDAEIKKMLNMK